MSEVMNNWQISERLEQAGVSVCAVYHSTSEPGVYQAECYGKVKRHIKQFEQAGFTEVTGQQDWMDDEPYSLIRFRTPTS